MGREADENGVLRDTMYRAAYSKALEAVAPRF